MHPATRDFLEAFDSLGGDRKRLHVMASEVEAEKKIRELGGTWTCYDLVTGARTPVGPKDAEIGREGDS